MLNKYSGHLTQYSQKQFYWKGRAKTEHKIGKSFIFALQQINSFGKFRGGTLATCNVVTLEAKFAGFVMSVVCSYLTLFTFSGLVFYKLSIVSEV